jgi:hypothetical protein
VVTVKNFIGSGSGFRCIGLLIAAWLLLASQGFGDVVPWVQVEGGIAWNDRKEWEKPADPGMIFNVTFGTRINLVGKLVLEPYLGYQSLMANIYMPFEDIYIVGGKLQYGITWLRLEHFCIHPVLTPGAERVRGRYESRTFITIGTRLEFK